MVGLMNQPADRLTLTNWLTKLDVIIGQNISFDILYLRAFDPAFRAALDGRQLLVDTQILNYLHHEERPEGSLKNLGPVMGLYQYERTLKHRLFNNPIDREDDGYTLSDYNGSDTHATMLLAGELCRLIAKDYGPDTPKLTPFTFSYYSDSLWCGIRKSEAGLPMSRSRVVRMEADWQSKVQQAEAACHTKWGFPLSGPGSGLAKDAFIDELIASVDEASRRDESILDHPLLEKSPPPPKGKGKISWSMMNFRVMQSHLDPKHPLHAQLALVIEHQKYSKLISSYTYPLLRHRKTKPHTQENKLLCNPKYPLTQFGYTTWYITPSKYAKDDAGKSGGQQQARPSVKGPAAQTFPPVLRSAYKSRFLRGGILGFDISQAELRVAALLSGDPYIVAAYVEGRCLHTERAQQIFNKDIINDPDFKSRYRQCAKHTNFTDLNLGGAKMLQKTIMKKSDVYVDISFCQDIVRSRPTQRPGLTEWQNKLIADTRQAHLMVLPFTGISRHFLGNQHEDKSTIVNLPIQATAATMLWRIEHYLHNNVLPAFNDPDPDVFLYLNHYDALYFDCRNREIAENLLTSCVEGLRYVENHDYWSWMQQLYGRKIPLDYSADFIGFPEDEISNARS